MKSKPGGGSRRTAARRRRRQGGRHCIVEAMKMEIPVSSPASGTIKALLVAVDEIVQEDQALIIIEV
jgi:biotin carboxyl carrier protein